MCTACGTGTYSTGTGATSSSTCESCGAGQYGDQTAQSGCKSCEAGRYSAATGATSSTTCTGCAAGRYSGATGATSSSSCTRCPQGRYYGSTGASSSTTCTGCAAGKSGDYFEMAVAGSPNLVVSDPQCATLEGAHGYTWNDFDSDANIFPKGCFLYTNNKFYYNRHTGSTPSCTTTYPCVMSLESDPTNANYCLRCAVGKTSSGAASQCSYCPAGQDTGAALGPCQNCVSPRIKHKPELTYCNYYVLSNQQIKCTDMACATWSTTKCTLPTYRTQLQYRTQIGWWWIYTGEDEWNMMGTTRTSSPSTDEKGALICMTKMHKYRDDAWFTNNNNANRNWEYVILDDHVYGNGGARGWYRCYLYSSAASGSWYVRYYYSHVSKSDCGY